VRGSCQLGDMIGRSQRDCNSFREALGVTIHRGGEILGGGVVVNDLCIWRSGAYPPILDIQWKH
jgi:hypothetical protein